MSGITSSNSARRRASARLVGGDRLMSTDGDVKLDPEDLLDALLFDEADNTVPTLGTLRGDDDDDLLSLDQGVLASASDEMGLGLLAFAPGVASAAVDAGEDADMDDVFLGYLSQPTARKVPDLRNDSDPSDDSNDEDEDEDEDGADEEPPAKPAQAKVVRKAAPKPRRRGGAAPSAPVSAPATPSAAPSTALAQPSAAQQPSATPQPADGKGKPKRKITPKRQERNRDSARKFRQRKKEYISTLEEEAQAGRERARTLELRLNKAEEERAHLQRQLAALTGEVEALRQSAVTSSSPSLSSSSPRPLEQREQLGVGLKRGASDDAYASGSESKRAHVDSPTMDVDVREKGADEREAAVAAPAADVGGETAGEAAAAPLPMATLMSLFAMPRFRALALLVLLAAVVTFMYGPNLDVPMSVPIAQVSLAQLNEHLHQHLHDAPASPAPFAPWTPPSDAGSPPSPTLGEPDALAHLAAQFSASSYTAAIGSVLLMTMFDPSLQKWKPFLQAP